MHFLWKNFSKFDNHNFLGQQNPKHYMFFSSFYTLGQTLLQMTINCLLQLCLVEYISKFAHYPNFSNQHKKPFRYFF